MLAADGSAHWLHVAGGNERVLILRSVGLGIYRSYRCAATTEQPHPRTALMPEAPAANICTGPGGARPPDIQLGPSAEDF